MKNEKLIWQALKILYNRAQYWENIQLPDKSNFYMAGAYQNAHDILLYALDGNEECLRQFDTYGKEK